MSVKYVLNLQYAVGRRQTGAAETPVHADTVRGAGGEGVRKTGAERPLFYFFFFNQCSLI